MKSLSLLAIASLASAFCSHGTTLFPRSANGAPISDFNYDALTGPLNWAGLDTATTHICSLGKTQSPINIVTKDYTPTSGSTLNFAVENYPDGAEIENLGSTLEVIVNGSLTVKGKEYSLKQFHFHTPSEHRLDDEYFPMEAHFVFQADGMASLPQREWEKLEANKKSCPRQIHFCGRGPDGGRGASRWVAPV